MLCWKILPCRASVEEDYMFDGYQVKGREILGAQSLATFWENASEYNN